MYGTINLGVSRKTVKYRIPILGWIQGNLLEVSRTVEPEVPGLPSARIKTLKASQSYLRSHDLGPVSGICSEPKPKSSSLASGPSGVNESEMESI